MYENNVIPPRKAMLNCKRREEVQLIVSNRYGDNGILTISCA